MRARLLTASNSSANQRVQLFITANSKLQMSGGDALDAKILRSVACPQSNLSELFSSHSSLTYRPTRALRRSNTPRWQCSKRLLWHQYAFDSACEPSSNDGYDRQGTAEATSVSMRSSLLFRVKCCCRSYFAYLMIASRSGRQHTLLKHRCRSQSRVRGEGEKGKQTGAA